MRYDSNYRSMLNHVIQYPHDDGPRLVMADYLDDMGDHARASFIRFSITSCPPPIDPVEPHYECGCQWPNANPPCQYCTDRPAEEQEAHDQWVADVRQLKKDRKKWEEEKQEASAYNAPDVLIFPIYPRMRVDMSTFPGSLWGPTTAGPATVGVVWRRGFIDEVLCDVEAFRDNAHSIFTNHPVTKVRFTLKLQQSDFMFNDEAARPVVSQSPSVFSESVRLWSPCREIGQMQWIRDWMSAKAGRDVVSLLYKSPEDALVAISQASVHYGRKLAGFEPLDEIVDTVAMTRTVE